MSDDEDGDLDPRVRQTHEAVHAAVLALLAEGGLDAVRHARVAATSGVSRATVYRHWPDRAALLVSTLRAMRPRIVAPPRTGDVRADVRELLGTFASHLNDNQMLADMLVLLQQADDDPDLAVVRDHVIPVEGNPLRALLVDAREQGALRQDVAVETLLGTLLGPLLAFRVVLRRELTPGLVDDLVATWFEGAAA